MKERRREMEERRREMEEERSQETVTGCHAVVSGDSENVSVELISQSVKSTRHVDERDRKSVV